MTIPYGRTNRQPSNINELRNTAFQFHLKDMDSLNFFIVSGNLPGLALGGVNQTTPLGNVPRSGDGVFEELQLQFIVDEDLTNWLEVYNWIRTSTTLANRDDFDETQIYRDGFLVIKSNALNPKIRIQFKNLVPQTLSGLDFDSRASEPEILVASVNFAYTEYDVETII